MARIAAFVIWFVVAISLWLLAYFLTGGVFWKSLAVFLFESAWAAGFAERRLTRKNS